MSKKSHKKVFRFIAHDSMEALGTCIAVVICKHFFRQFGITGVDMHKKHKQTIPEAMGIAAGIVLCWFMPDGPIRHCTIIGLGIGAMDDIVDIKWKTKLIMSALAYVPLYQPNTEIVLFGNLFEIGILYHIYMIVWCIWCGNSINIYAGINGLESGQCLVVAIGLFFVVDTPIAGYIGACAVLFAFNWFPASIFVGDSWCYLSGMFFVSSAQHDTETLAIMMLPQIINTVMSLPELLGECPRHRMPNYDVTNDVLISSGKGTLLNAILVAWGPMKERKLCLVALAMQIACVLLAIFINTILK